MRVGQHPVCVTPNSEAHAQLQSDGISGSYRGVLDFDYDNEFKVGSWEEFCRFTTFIYTRTAT
jgi:hypothetical protein